MKPTMEEENKACLHASLVSSSFVLPMVLNAAIELDLLEIINKAGPGAQISPSDIASQLPTRNPAAASMIDRMLRLLASHHLLTSSVSALDNAKLQRLYGLAPAGKLFVKGADEGSMATFILFSRHKAILDMRFHLKDAVLEGGVTFEKAHGMPLFEYVKREPTFNKAFNEAMSEYSTMIMKLLLKNYKGFEGLTSLVDVGGGIGTTLSMIISQYPHVKGVNFDIPQVLENAPAYDGIQHVGGDMFKEVPKASAIFLKWITHNWNDEKCLKLLKNCYAALPDKGKVIIVDALLSEAPDTSMEAKSVSHLDNIMLMEFDGKERSENELRALAKRAGFSSFGAVCCVCANWIMELTK